MIDSTNISVIVCCYEPSYDKLLKTLISIEKQKDVVFDIVITDDGSEVDYFREIETWAKNNHFKNIFFNKNEQNVGTVRNILSAIEMCKSNYIKTISPGDFLYDEKSLKSYYKCFIENDATIVSGESVYFDLNNKIIPSFYPKLAQSCRPKYMKRNLVKYGDSLLGASLAFDRFFLKNKLNYIKETVKYLEDKPLVDMCLIEGKKVFFLNEKLVWYEYGGGISTGKKPNPLFINDLNNYYRLISKSTNSYLSYISKVYFDNQKYSKIAKLFLFPFRYPGYFLFTLKTKLKNYRIIEKDINKLYKITTLE